MVSGSKKKTVVHILLITALGLLAYSNTFHIPFQFDDEVRIFENPVVKDFSYYFQPSAAAEALRGNYTQFISRAVGYLTFTLNYKIHGADVAGYHIFNLAVHLLNALLVYMLVLVSFKTPFLKDYTGGGRDHYVAFFSGLLFVSHPVETQAVTYIVQRFASLAALFYLASFLSYIKFRLSKRLSHRLAFYALTLAFALLSLKTKEFAVTLPVTITVFELYFFGGSLRKRLLNLIPLILMLVLVPLSYIEPGKSLDEISRVQTSISRLDYLLTQFTVIVTYIRLIFFPINQNLDYDYTVYDSFFSPAVLLSFLFLLSIVAMGFFLFIRSRRGAREMRLASFGIFWFFITLLPESGLIPIVDMIFEHRLYLPTVGAFISMATVMFLTATRHEGSLTNKAMVAACALVAVSFLGITYARNTVWASRTGLWEDVVKKSPRKLRGYFNLGVAYQDSGLIDRAIEKYKKALDIRPYNPETHTNLAKCYASTGRFDLAIEHYRETLKLRPDNATIYNDIGICYNANGLHEEAIEHYGEALRLKPDLAAAHFNLGNAYFELGETDRAIHHYQEALRIRPNLAEAHNNLGNIYVDGGQTNKAMQHFEEALKLRPDLPEARSSLGSVYFNMGQTDVAIEHFKNVVKSNPRHADAQFNLGLAYLAENDTENAISHFQKALRLRPVDPGLYFNLGRACFAGGMTDKAIEYYQTAVRLRPDFAEAHIDLARLYKTEGLQGKAAEHLKMAQEINGAIGKSASR